MGRGESPDGIVLAGLKMVCLSVLDRVWQGIVLLLLQSLSLDFHAPNPVQSKFSAHPSLACLSSTHVRRLSQKIHWC